MGVTLFMGAPNFSRENGVRAKGTLTAPDPGNGCGWMTAADVVAAMRSGSTHVNVHTNDRMDPPNTGRVASPAATSAGS